MLDTTFLKKINVDDSAGGENINAVPAKDSGAAERMRRHRAKKRDRNGTVTHRNAHDVPAVTADGDTVTGSAHAQNLDGVGEIVLCPAQAQITLSFNGGGDLVLRQTCWPDEDQTIVVGRDNIGPFIDALMDAIGVPSVGGP